MGIRKSIHIFHSPVSGSESRLMKTCNSIISLKIADLVIGLGYIEGELKANEIINSQFKIHRVECHKNKVRRLRKGYFRKFMAFLSIIIFYVKSIYFCIRERPYSISCHNAQLLPLCLILKILIGVKLIYEPHELESHKTSLSKIMLLLTKYIEKFTLPLVDSIITVCPPITDFYIKNFRIKNEKIFTIRNIPVNPSLGTSYKRSNLLREEFQIPEDDIIFLYQGLIDEARNIRNYLETFQKANAKFHIVFMGYGELEKTVLEYAQNYKNIHFKSAVPIDKIIEYTSSADIGLFVLTGQISLSYRYSLPNKFFEYAIAGLRICVSDNLELLSSYVSQYRLGDIISSDNNSLSGYLRNIEENTINKLIEKESIVYRQNFGWQNEEKIFLLAYN